MLIAAALPCALAIAALPGAVLVPPAENSPDNKYESRQAAIAALSGSPFAGVIDHLLQYPANDNDNNGVLIHINYPSIGIPGIDADIRAWTAEMAEAFKSHFDLNQLSELPEDIDSQIEAYMQKDESGVLGNTDPRPLELLGSYSVSRPSDSAISITFEIWNYTGNPQGNLDILTLNYNLLNNRRLGLVDIFENPGIALQLMSTWARNKLGPRLNSTGGGQMLLDGTMPLEENFSSLTLTPEGIRINFQPYQVASWNAGIQKVDMPLKELTEAGPLLSLWGK